MGASDADRNARSGRNGRSGSSAAVAVDGVQLAMRDCGSGEPMVALDEFLPWSSVHVGVRSPSATLRVQRRR